MVGDAVQAHGVGHMPHLDQQLGGGQALHFRRINQVIATLAFIMGAVLAQPGIGVLRDALRV